MMTQTEVMLPIREKDTVIGSFRSTTTTSPAATAESVSGSSAGSRSVADREHQEAPARLEHEVHLLWAQQQQSQNLVAFDDVPPPQYDTL